MFCLGEVGCIQSIRYTCEAPNLRVRNGKLFFLFLNQTYVVGTKKNRLNETVLFSTQNNV